MKTLFLLRIWIKQTCNRTIWDFAIAFRVGNVFVAFGKPALSLAYKRKFVLCFVLPGRNQSVVSPGSKAQDFRVQWSCTLLSVFYIVEVALEWFSLSRNVQFAFLIEQRVSGRDAELIFIAIIISWQNILAKIMVPRVFHTPGPRLRVFHLAQSKGNISVWMNTTVFAERN